MGIINPIMLWFSLSGLLIVAMYFIKNRYVDFLVPSIRLWERVINEESNISKFEKFKNRKIMYIQLLILIMLILMLSGVYINSKDKLDGNILLVIDNSIMMDYRESEISNLEKAKEEAIKIIEKSSENANFEIVSLSGKFNFANDKLDAIKYIKDIYQLNTNLSSAKIKSEIKAFNSSNEDGYVVVFSNDKSIIADKNFRYKSMNDNVGITKIDVYKSSYNIEINNYSKIDKSIEIILKLNNEAIDIFNINIPAKDIKIISGSLENLKGVLSVKLNSDDDIDIDNFASKTIEKEKSKKLFLSKSSSSYLRDALRLNKNLVISESVEGEILNSGFDIYVYQGVEPDKLPTTGSMLLVNPPSTSKFVSGEAQSEKYIKLSNDKINSFIEAFYVANSKELNAFTLKTVGSIEGKSIVQKGKIGELSVLVMGFDLLDTNLPLKYSFPVYIQNIVDYFIGEKNNDEIFIVSDKINLDNTYTKKEEVIINREGASVSVINLKFLIAILVFIFLIIEMGVFKNEY